tara:strand:+ start:1129 stop:1752 length:624 start_codon:yes stop_codon:yes gene_type:complete
MEQVTIERVLDQPLIEMVKLAPTNPMTRGQVRASTNLVIPDEVVTSEGIIEYVLENFDPSKAPSSRWARDQELQAQRRQRDERLRADAERRQRLDNEALFIVNCDGTQSRDYTSYETHRAFYSVRTRFSAGDFDGLESKEEVVDKIRDMITDQMHEEGYHDEEHMDTHNTEFEDSEPIELDEDAEEIWENNKDAIASALGLTPEEME